MLKILSLTSALLLAVPALAGDGPDWSYDGDQNGQESWGMLSHRYAACELGRAQSPINIASTKLSYKTPLTFRYKPSKADIVYEDLALVAHIKAPLHVKSEGRDYALERIMFHSPGEHTILKEFHVLEIHFMHRDKDGNRLIVAVLGDLGEANPTLQTMLDKPSLTFDPSGLLPESHHFYAYSGSLTFPPCTEGVEWRILKEPITLSQEQLHEIGEIVGRNARIVQPIYMREVEENGR